ncbi:uncharacterized protein [Bemisia tabaci]|uniref:uncharacterized protein n=1 Tax=Bemisia tabaci TaxID=7038 RepID=UPI003B284CA2
MQSAGGMTAGVKAPWGALLALALACAATSGSEDDCAIAPPFHHIPGTYTVTGIFDIHHGANCSQVNENGFAMMTSAIHTIRLLNDIQYIPGVDVGLLIYDTCSKHEEAQKAVVQSHVMNECTLSVSLGILTTARIAEELKNLSQALQLNLSVVPEPVDTQVLIDSTVELLTVLGKKVVDVIISDDVDFSQGLVSAITKRKICVKKTTDMDTAEDLKITSSDGFLIIAGSAQYIQSKLKHFPRLTNCILVPLAGRLNMSEVAFIKNHHIMSIENSIFRVRSANNSRTHRDADHSELPETTEGTGNDPPETAGSETGSSETFLGHGNSNRQKFNEVLSKSEINKVDKLRILFELLHNGGMKNLDDIIHVEEEQEAETTGNADDSAEMDVTSSQEVTVSEASQDATSSQEVTSSGEDDRKSTAGEMTAGSSAEDSQESTVTDDEGVTSGAEGTSTSDDGKATSEAQITHSSAEPTEKADQKPHDEPEMVEKNLHDVDIQKSMEAHFRNPPEVIDRKHSEDEEGESVDSTIYKQVEKPRIYYINTIRMEPPPEMVQAERTGKRLPNSATHATEIRLEITARVITNGSSREVEIKEIEPVEDQIAEETVDSPEILPPNGISGVEDITESATEEVEVDMQTTPLIDLDGVTTESTLTTMDDKEYIEDSPIESSDPADKFRAFFSEDTELIKINLGLIRVARSVIKMIEQFKMDFNIRCFYETHNSSCGGKSERTVVTSPSSLDEEIASVARLLKFEKNVLINGLNVESAYGEILFEFNFDAEHSEWYMSKNGREVQPNATSYNICAITNCSECVNFQPEVVTSGRRIWEFLKRLSVKTDVYVVVLLTISVIGIILSLCVGTFIVVRILKKDILEGNPLLTMLLLLAVIFTYCAVLPFVLKVTDDGDLAYSTLPQNEEVFIYHKSSESVLYVQNILCLAKIIMMSTSFNLLFGIILARSLMLSNCDRDGSFLSHIDGYIQVTLLFFILLVQICVNVELYIFNARYDLKICIENSNMSLYFQIYNTFLLILCIITAPFIYKSRRNYNEGLYLTIVVIFLAIVWFVWISIYQFYDPSTTGIPNIKEMAALSGLVASATGVLILIFIPRTYLMLTGIVRDNITASLPTLGFTNSSSVLDVTQYRSTQALYDTVGQGNTIKSGQMNPNYYMERPTTPSTSKLEPTTSRTPENTYER